MGLFRKKEQKTVKKPVEYSGWWKTEPLILKGYHIPCEEVEKDIKGKKPETPPVEIWKEAKRFFGFAEDILSKITYVTREDRKKVEIQINGTQKKVNEILTQYRENFEKCYGVEIDLDKVKLQPD